MDTKTLQNIFATKELSISGTDCAKTSWKHWDWNEEGHATDLFATAIAYFVTSYLYNACNLRPIRIGNISRRGNVVHDLSKLKKYVHCTYLFTMC